MILEHPQARLRGGEGLRRRRVGARRERGGRGPWLSSSLEIGFEEMPAPWLPGLAEQLRARFVEAAGARARCDVERARRLLDAAPPGAARRRAAAPARPRGAGLGPGAQGREGRGGEVDGRGAGLREEERGRGRDAAARAPRTRRSRASCTCSFVRKDGRPADAPRSCRGSSPRLLRALAFPKRMSWDAWLDDGRGAFPFGRPIRWLVAAARRRGRAVRHPRARGRGEGRGRRRERARDARPPLPAEGPRRRGRSRCARSPSCASACASASCSSTRPSALARIDAGPARPAGGRRSTTTACARSGATSSSTRRSCVGEVPAEFRALPAGGARDGARPPPEVHLAA